jgi:hypothetical protein
VIDLLPQTASPVWESGLVTDSAGDGAAWNFFASYTQAIRTCAEWITWLLEEDGYRVLTQAWGMVPGSNWISRALAGGRPRRRGDDQSGSRTAPSTS